MKVSARAWLRVYLDDREQSLAELIRGGKPVPPERLRQMRAAMHSLVSEELFDNGADDGAYGYAAKRLRDCGAADVVVMGHTHLARHHGPTGKAAYINSGTWADVIKVPAAALADSEQGLAGLEAFLHGLIDDSVRWFRPMYADIRVSAHGTVEHARLEEWQA